MRLGSIHRNLYEHVEEAIGLRIIKGELPPGDTLPNEDALCAEFGVSRGVIREAIKVLQKKGLVLPRPKVGTQIQKKVLWNLFDADVLVWTLKAGKQISFLAKVTEVRSLIESEAARLSAGRATGEEIAEMQHLFNRLSNTLGGKQKFDYEKYLQADMAFHTAILDTSHNELLAQIGRTMRTAVQTARQTDIRGIAILVASQPLHAEIMEAIAVGDSEMAYSASQQMFARVWDYILENESNFSAA